MMHALVKHHIPGNCSIWHLHLDNLREIFCCEITQQTFGKHLILYNGYLYDCIVGVQQISENVNKEKI